VKTICSMAAIAIFLTTGLAARGEPPPVDNERSVYQLQSRWTSDLGRSLELAELAGHYQIVGFIFTHCGGACPLLVKSLQVQSRSMPQQVHQRTRFLLVSIDPERDTVEALRSYRRDMALDERWTLLRGSDSDVRELAAVVGFNYERTPEGQFAHSNQVTLLDPTGEIVLQHPAVEGAVSTMSTAIAACDETSTASARPRIAGKNCH
jgi:protein SCO1/2